jgi:hypothetical protein
MAARRTGFRGELLPDAGQNGKMGQNGGAKWRQNAAAKWVGAKWAKWVGQNGAKWVIHDKDLSRENALFPALNGRDS